MRFTILLLSLLLLSCTEDSTVSVPDYDPGDEVAGMARLSAEIMQAMEGIYKVEEGNPLLGDEIVLKYTGGSLSLFSGRDALWCFFDSGRMDSTLHLAGYWRKQVNEETGVIRLTIDGAEGGGMLQRGERPRPGEVLLRGDYGSGAARSQREVLLTYSRPLHVDERPFLILAHRAGGRNSDRLPAAENSVELVRLAERFGANGVEIDVQLTADGVPVIYHDEYLNQRLTQKSGLVGKIGEYTLAQLETFVHLPNGERIPTLKRMLAVILRQTNLRFVWLDSKPSVPLALLRDVQRAYADSAHIFGRDLQIVIGLPDEEKVAEFLRLPDYAEASALCELDIETVRRTESEFWAPRWTLGTQNALTTAMQAEGRRVLSWTLDEPGYIQSFLRDGRFDGILTNYPALIAYFYYSQ
ncbi:MAG: glycerophosphodiester phosphodiesterase [Bacteroidetes bacterium]|nr:glycerophosphodiester phosphodiesterase [Bacteroidota bacterium]